MRSHKTCAVIPDTRSVIRDPEDRRVRRLRPLGSGFRLRRPRNDGVLFIFIIALLALSACSTFAPPPSPLPTSGPIAYACANGAQLMVDFESEEARVAIIGGPSMVLPRTGEGAYSNGRYALHGQGASAQWQVGRAAPVSCRGS